jgi:cyclohexadienyl dehydratase
MRYLFWAMLAMGMCAASYAQPDHLGRIRSVGEVRVCIWPEYYGISFRNPLTQELAGLDVDMARELGQDLGVRVRFVDSSFGRLIDDLANDRCDVAMFGIGITPARQQKLRFTRPHLRSDVYGITTRSNRRVRFWEDIDKPGRVVAVAKGTLHETVMGEKLQAAKLLVMDTAQARELEVESGRADVFMTDYPYSRRMLESTDWARLVSPPSPFHLTSYAYAMQPGDDVWYARLERFVGDVKRDGRLASAAQRHKLLPIIVSD